MKFHEDFDPIVINVDRSRHFIVDFWHVKIEAMKDFLGCLQLQAASKFLRFFLCYIHCKAEHGRTWKSCNQSRVILLSSQDFPVRPLFNPVWHCRLSSLKDFSCF